MATTWHFDPGGRAGTGLLEFRGSWTSDVHEGWLRHGRPPVLWEGRKGQNCRWVAESGIDDLAVIGSIEDDSDLSAATGLRALRLFNSGGAALDW